MGKLRFKDGSLVFKLDGYISKAGTKPPHLLNFTSQEIEELFEAFFDWLGERDLEFGGALGTEMEESKHGR